MGDGKGREDERMEEEAKERRRLLFRKSDRELSSQDVQEHMKTLIPYRSWCDQCIRGRGRNDPTSQEEESEDQGPSSPRDETMHSSR